MLLVDTKAREIMARLNKKYDTDMVSIGSESVDYGRIPSGSLGLDLILGGGWPANQWHEILGDESCGKTALVYNTIAENQRRDPDFTAVFVAAEEYVKQYAEMCGVDTSRLLVVETNVMEEAYHATLEFAESRAVDCVAIDSLPALIPDAENEKGMDGSSPGTGAILTGKFFRKVGKATKRNLDGSERPFLGLMINQYRMKIGVMYGDPRTTPGGLGKNFAYFTRIELKRDEWLECGVGKGKDKIGQSIRATTKKNKSAPPGQVAMYDFYFGAGGPVLPGHIDYAQEVVTLAILFEIVERAGAWYKYEGEKWQGKDGLLQAVREEPDLFEALDAEVRQVTRRAAA